MLGRFSFTGLRRFSACSASSSTAASVTVAASTGFISSSSSITHSSYLHQQHRHQSSSAAEVVGSSSPISESSHETNNETSISFNNNTVSTSNNNGNSNSSLLSCLLCDEEVLDWHDHCQTVRHSARLSICEELCAPERNAAMISQLWDHIRLDFDAVDEATAYRVSRRRKRLSSTAKHLRDSQVLQDCLLFEAQQQQQQQEKVPENKNEAEQEQEDDDESVVEKRFRVAPSFTKLVHLGERAMRAELVDRVLRLFPAASAGEAESVVSFLMSASSMASIFDLLDVKRIVHVNSFEVEQQQQQEQEEKEVEESEKQKEEKVVAAALKKRTNTKTTTTIPLDLVALSDSTKRQSVLALIGELSLWSSVRQRPTSVTCKADADVIVTHVLATHVVENLTSELLHHSVQKVVDEGTPVWREFKDSVVSMISASRRQSMSLLPEKAGKPMNKFFSALEAMKENSSSLQHQQEKMNQDIAILLEHAAEGKEQGEKRDKERVFDQLTQAEKDSIEEFLSQEIDIPQPRLFWNSVLREGLLDSTLFSASASSTSPSSPKSKIPASSSSSSSAGPTMAQCLPKVTLKPKGIVPTMSPAAAAAAAAAASAKKTSPSSSSSTTSVNVSATSIKKEMEASAANTKSQMEANNNKQKKQQQRQQQKASPSFVNLQAEDKSTTVLKNKKMPFSSPSAMSPKIIKPVISKVASVGNKQQQQPTAAGGAKKISMKPQHPPSTTPASSSSSSSASEQKPTITTISSGAKPARKMRLTPINPNN